MRIKLRKFKIALALLAAITISSAVIVAVMNKSSENMLGRDLMWAVKRRNYKGYLAAEAGVYDSKDASLSGAVIVAVMNKSSENTLGRDLMCAVKRRNYEGYLAAEAGVYKPFDASFRFAGETERLALYQAHGCILRDWLMDRTLWPSQLVFGIILYGGSPTDRLPSSSGFGDTEEGFELISKVVEEINKESGNPYNRLVVTKDADGTVSIGKRITLR